MTAASTLVQSLELDIDTTAVEVRYSFVLDAELAHVGGGSAVVEY